MTHTLAIHSTARTENSVTRNLTEQVIDRLSPVTTVTRDLITPISQINEDWVNANFTPASDRSPTQKQTLALSDTLVGELQGADTIVIGVPIYNFGVPASLKAWIDMICRARVTFKYGENGPEGLLTDKRAILVVASGGVTVGSDMDFATPYMRRVLGFVGITDVTIIAATGGNTEDAVEQIAAL